MASQLEVQREMNKLLKERTGILQEHADLLSSQISTASAIQKAWEGATPKEIIDHIKELNEALEESAKKFDENGAVGSSSNEKINKGVVKSHASITATGRTLDEISRKRWPALTAAVLGAVNGIISGFKFVTNVLKSTGSLVTTVVEGFLDIAVAVTSIPFKVLDGLVSAASKLSGLMQEIATATEEVRKQFGDLSKGPAQSVISSAKELGKGWEKMGLGGYRIFGNLAERIKHVNQVATEMGPTFEGFRKEFEKDGGALLLMQKGLGITNEDMKGLGSRAAATGQTLTEQFKEIHKFSHAFGDTFHLDAKLISRDMAMMARDVKNFGNLSYKELAKTSTYARALRVDVKDLLGVVDKFDTFESAAESAAQLSQAFGVQVDAVKLMKMENPADRIEEIRRAFLATGQSADKMNRQELKYLGTITNLSEETVKAAFSQKNLGASMADLEKQGKITEKRQVSTGEAVQELSSSIERMIKAFRPFTGFLQAFADGFARGFFMAEPMRDLLTELYKALRQTYMIGMKVGEAFMTLFPSIKEITALLKDMFSVADGKATGRFKTFLDSIKTTFTKFFTDVGGGGKGSVKEFIKSLQKNFFDWIDKDGKQGRALIENVSKFAGVMGTIISGMVETLAEGIVEGAKTLGGLFEGKGLPDIGSGDGIIAKFIAPIWKTLKEQGPAVGQALLDMLDKAWKWAEPHITKFAWSILPYIATLIVGPAIIQGFAAFVGAKIAGAIGSAMAGVAEKVADSEGIEKVTDVIEKATTAGEKSGDFAETMNKLSWQGIAKMAVGLGAAIIAIGAATAVVAFVLKRMDMPSLEQIVLFGALAFTLATTASGLAVAAGYAGKFGWKTIAQGMVGIGVGMVAIGSAAAATLWMLKEIGPIPPQVAPVIEAISSLFKTAALLVVPAALLGAALSGPQAAIIAGVGAAGFAVLGIIANGLVASAIPAVKVIAGLDIPNPEQFKMVAGVTISIMESIAKFTDSIARIIETMADIKGEKFSVAMGSVKKFVDAILKEGFNDTVDKIIDMGANLGDKAGALEGAKAIGDVISSLGSFVSSIAAVVSGIPDDGFFKSLTKTGESFSTKMESASTFLFNVMSTLQANLKPMIESFIGIKIGDPKVAQEKLSIISSALSIISSVVNSIKEFRDIAKEGGTIDEGSMNELILLGGRAFGQVPMNHLSSVVDNIITRVPAQASMEQALSNIQNVEKFQSSAIKSAQAMEKIHLDAQQLGFYNDVAATPTALVITKMVEEANMINDALRDLPTINVKTKLKELADRLGLKGEQFTVKSDKVNVLVNLDVTIDADKLVKVLGEHGVVTTARTK